MIVTTYLNQVMSLPVKSSIVHDNALSNGVFHTFELYNSVLLQKPAISVPNTWSKPTKPYTK